MSTGIQILLSVLPTVGAIMIAVLNLRSGNRKLDDNNSEIREISPKVSQTLKYAEKNNTYIVEKFSGKIDALVDETRRNDKRYDVISVSLATITDDIQYRKRLTAETASRSRDVVISSVDELFKENAMLRNENFDLKKQIADLKLQLDRNKENEKSLSDNRNNLVSRKDEYEEEL